MCIFLFLILQTLLSDATFLRCFKKCDVDNGGCEYFCKNTCCSCPEGLVLDFFGKRCIDLSGRICKAPAPMKNGDYGKYDFLDFVKVSRREVFKENDALTLRCHKGYAGFPKFDRPKYRSNGFFEEETLCIGGKWSKHFSCLRSRTCTVPDIQNGEFGRYTSPFNFEKVSKTDIITDKEVLNLRCHEGYTSFPRQKNHSRQRVFVGEITCEGGTWSEELLCLSNSCNFLPRIKGLSLDFKHQKRNHGDVITYTFFDGSTLMEKGKAMCQFREWIRVSSESTDSCNIDDLKEYEGLIVPENVTPKNSEVVDILCKEGYSPSGKLIVCQNGTWKVPRNPCIKKSITCPFFETSPGVEVLYDGGVPAGKYASFRCSSGNVLQGDSSISLCLNNGTWSHSLPRCKEYGGCPEFSSPPGLQVSYSKGFSVDSVATFSCSPPYILDGSLKAICQSDKTWSHPLPTCKETKTCPEYETLPGLEVSYTDSVLVGSYASFSCDVATTLVGNSYAICQNNGTWSHPLPSCKGLSGCYLKKPDTSSLQIDPIKENYSFGELIYLRCPSGQEITRNVVLLMCLGEVWSHDLPDCVESI